MEPPLPRKFQSLLWAVCMDMFWNCTFSLALGNIFLVNDLAWPNTLQFIIQYFDNLLVKVIFLHPPI